MMPNLERRTFMAALASLAALPLGAQFKRAEGSAPRTDTEGNATFRVDVDVVNILATVRDKKGAIVNNLQREDFQLLDGGVARDIHYFARQSDIPLTIGILFDTSLSQRNVLEIQRDAAFQFLDHVLRPEQDEAFIIKFDAEVELVQDLTASRELLRRAIAGLRTPEPQQGRRPQTWPQPNTFQIGVGIPGTRRTRRIPGRPGGPAGPRPPQGGGTRRVPTGVGTLLYDAVFLAADEVLAEKQGRKAILLISDGVDYGSKLTRESTVESAQRADTLVYSVFYADNQGYGAMHSRGGSTLRFLSAETGGGMFEVSEKYPIDWVFGQIDEELRNQYSLGFAPTPDAGPAFRPIELRVNQKDLHVRTRKGYFPKSA
ncbi:MAG: VWA domain-containing protein [Bryobacterales bacterium]|nr:VWA domain-containing protein [Bryobacterales bacterium]